MSAFTPSGSGGIPQTVRTTGLTSPQIQTITITNSNTEQSVSLPSSVRKYEIQVYGVGHLKVAHTSGASSTDFIEIGKGCYLIDDEIEPAGPITLYVQSSATGVVARVRYWT